MSKLYIVGTPIGNLSDMSPRGLKTLEEADFIAAEDTRVTLKLLNRFGIKKPMISYYEHNLRERGREIADRIQKGESCAVVTDAGMPCISDPGEDLIRLCAERGIEIETVPGPSAAITALALSGMPAGRFCFEGFLSVRKTSRFEHLNEIKNDARTLVFYEAPHKLINTLRDMLEAFGDREIALCRELTKLHEEALRTTLSVALRHYEDKPPKGEYVLVVAGAKKPEREKITLEAAAALLREKIASGVQPAAAAREVARATGHKKNELYRLAMGQNS